jgi:hypothetical protein
MNQRDKNLILFLKTVVFMIFCLLAFSAGANGDSDYDSFQENVLTAEVQTIPAHAILTPATDGLTPINTFNTPDNNSPFSVSNKLAFDSYLFNQLLITLRKSRETIIALHGSRYYLPVIPAYQDDLPDLS